MEIKVLGTVAPYPKGNMNCSGFLVRDGDTKVLLDAGFGSSRELDVFKDLKNLTVIISHYHPDHYGDLLALANQTFIAKKLGYLDKPVDVYLPAPIRKRPSISGEWQTPVIFPSDSIDYDLLTNSENVNYFKYHTYDENKKLKIGDMEISFKKTVHPISTQAVKIISNGVSLVYSSDTDYENNSIVDFSRNADMLICEASFLRGQDKGNSGHLYAHEAGMIASSANVKNLRLFHTFPEIAKEKYVEEAKEYFKNTASLSEGEVIKLERRKNNE